MTSPENDRTSPLVPADRLGATARLCAGEAPPERRGLRHRIPVAAVERVEAGGRGGRTLILTVVAPDPPPRIAAAGAPAVAAFAGAVRRRPPDRDAAGPRPAVAVERVRRLRLKTEHPVAPWSPCTRPSCSC
ncbi:hypothetical protein [Streptomyces sp. NPDC006610]|uniref:hypothetical protein n=1 Tax=Streptomyces sp. NPDC006610 TaxID=3154584 RepID=UPI0033AA93EB